MNIGLYDVDSHNYKPRNAETSICPSKAIKAEIGGNDGARAREKTQSIGCVFLL